MENAKEETEYDPVSQPHGYLSTQNENLVRNLYFIKLAKLNYMKFDKTISILNDLLEINNDRIEGYNTAYEETDDLDLKRSFEKFRETSMECKLELEQEIIRCGGDPTKETKTTGKMFRAWMDFKAALGSNDRKAILKSCEQGEDAAVNAYEDVLNDHPTEYLSPNQMGLINEQYRLIKSDHNLVRSLRDTAVSD